MEWVFVNASHWQCVEDDSMIRYFSGHDGVNYQGFAWLKFDKRTKQILAARDHFGQEPFYYTRQGQQFIFGSSIRNILLHLPKTPKFSPHLIRDCFLRYPADDPIDDPPYSTETYYTGIFRVTPGNYLHVNQNSITETPFWRLDPAKPKLHYADPRDYVKHFELLLNEAIHVTTNNANDLALEFSGGIDSSMIFVASRKLGMQPTLFTHIPPKSRKPTAEDRNVNNLINQFDLSSKHIRVDAEFFDPMTAFQQFSHILSGPPPNLNCVLSNNIHQAIVQRGHRFVLSGYGGDDGVSLIFPPNKISTREELYQYEADLLQGKFSHEIRMRLEYTSVVAKSLGFRYIYPLLYPPLIEYCFSLPIEQKVKNGMMRCTAYEYLTKNIKQMCVSKKEGAVVPDTMQKCRDYYRLGKFSEQFRQLPFQEYITKRTTDDDKMLLQIHSYMAKQAQLESSQTQ